MSVRYKFKNDLEQSTLKCDGFHISAMDLKKEIVRQKKFGRVTEFDLIVTNAHTGETYKKDEDLIPKNSSLVIARHPLPKGQKKVWQDEVLSTAETSASVVTDGKSGGSKASAAISGSSFATGEAQEATEDQKLEALVNNPDQTYGRKNWIQYRGKAAYDGRSAPKHYKCNKCQNLGHWSFDCPLAKSGQDIKKTTGIPRSFLTPADANTPGVKINPQGLFMVNEMEKQAYEDKKKEKPIWEVEEKESWEKKDIPENLKCPVCNDLLRDAIMMPCCAGPVCDECARDYIIASETNKCPRCGEEDNSPDELIPWRDQRKEVDNFKKSHGFGAQQQAVEKKEDRPTLPDIYLPTKQDAAAEPPKPHTALGSADPSPEGSPTPESSPIFPDTIPPSALMSEPPVPGTGPEFRTPTPTNREDSKSPPPKVALPDVTLPPPGFHHRPPMPGYRLPSQVPSHRPYYNHGHHRDSRYVGVDKDGYIEDPLEAFNRAMAMKDAKKHRRSPPPRYHSPPRRYRELSPRSYRHPSRHRCPTPDRKPRGPRTPPHPHPSAASPGHSAPGTPPPPGTQSPGAVSPRPAGPPDRSPGRHHSRYPDRGYDRHHRRDRHNRYHEEPRREERVAPPPPEDFVEKETEEGVDKERTPSLSPEPEDRKEEAAENGERSREESPKRSSIRREDEERHAHRHGHDRREDRLSHDRRDDRHSHDRREDRHSHDRHSYDRRDDPRDDRHSYDRLSRARDEGRRRYDDRRRYENVRDADRRPRRGSPDERRCDDRRRDDRSPDRRDRDERHHRSPAHHDEDDYKERSPSPPSVQPKKDKKKSKKSKKRRHSDSGSEEVEKKKKKAKKDKKVGKKSKPEDLSPTEPPPPPEPAQLEENQPPVEEPKEKPVEKPVASEEDFQHEEEDDTLVVHANAVDEFDEDKDLQIPEPSKWEREEDQSGSGSGDKDLRELLKAKSTLSLPKPAPEQQPAAGNKSELESGEEVSDAGSEDEKKRKKKKSKKEKKEKKSKKRKKALKLLKDGNLLAAVAKLSKGSKIGRELLSRLESLQQQQRSPSPPPAPKHRSNRAVHAEGEVLQMTINRRRNRRSRSRSRSVEEKRRVRNRSRSPHRKEDPIASRLMDLSGSKEAKKKVSIKDRLGPVPASVSKKRRSDSGSDHGFSKDHWRGGKKPGREERGSRKKR